MVKRKIEQQVTKWWHAFTELKSIEKQNKTKNLVVLNEIESEEEQFC